MLVCKGYNISVDSKFGGNTENAVRDFQSKNNLQIDAIAGKNTFAKLFS
ncbi:MAG TPA: peptidoglycan-binding protein [Clostridiaceae bacterium]|nr:peptidoglycan-binding protein [Clostridiaceae bacterium]